MAKLNVIFYDSEDRKATVRVNFYPGTSNYFDNSFGNWLPGDPAECDEVSRVEEQGFDRVLTEDEIFAAAEKAYDTRDDEI
jgi:hypothetical protein